VYSSQSVDWQRRSRLSRLSQSMVRQVSRSYAQRLTPGTSADHRRRRKIGGFLISSRDCCRCVRRRHPRAVIADRLQQMLLMYTCRPRSTGGVKLLPTTLNNPPSSLGRSSLFCCRMTKKLLKTINTNPYSWPYPTHEGRSCPNRPIYDRKDGFNLKGFCRSTIHCVSKKPYRYE